MARAWRLVGRRRKVVTAHVSEVTSAGIHFYFLEKAEISTETLNSGQGTRESPAGEARALDGLGFLKWWGAHKDLSVQLFCYFV